MTGATGTSGSAEPAYEQVRAVTPYASVLLAHNPSPMTLEGTNTWLLRAPGEERCIVVDPGPADERHLQAVAAAGPVEVILLTHGHPDHSDGARRLHELTGAPVRALDPTHRYGSEGLAEGDVVTAPGLEVRVMATPGHSGDSVCFTVPGRAADAEGAAGTSGLQEGAAVLTGDTILGRGTTVVVYPDGRLGDYLSTLRRLQEFGAMTVLPGHGPELPDAGVVAERYLRHRARRLDQVRAIVAEVGPDVTAAEVVRRVYADVNPAVLFAAEMSVRAQLEYLRHGR